MFFVCNTKDARQEPQNGTDDSLWHLYWFGNAEAALRVDVPMDASSVGSHPCAQDA